MKYTLSIRVYLKGGQKEWGRQKFLPQFLPHQFQNNVWPLPFGEFFEGRANEVF